MPKLIIIGAGETAMMAYEYFTEDSTYEVAAFAVDSEFLEESTIYGCPVHPLEESIQIISTEGLRLFCCTIRSKVKPS